MKIRALVLFWGTALMAQGVRDHQVALKNWPAPLYWQPTQTETQGAGLRPEVQPVQAQVSTYALVFVAITPCRIVDTRVSQGFAAPLGPPSLAAGSPRAFPLQGSCTIPSSAQAYSLTVTLVPPGPVGYLTLWPTGQPQPNVVTLDDVGGQIVNTAAIVPAGTPNGSISAVASAPTDLVIDINGYYAASNTVTTSQSNTVNGFDALISNTSGTDNTANGYIAMDHNTTGSFNTATGSGAFRLNTSGSYNTANGAQALFWNNGSKNTATGYQALYNNTTASFGTANGYQALYSNTSGQANTADGFEALFTNTTGYNNTATGFDALKFSTGNSNTALGSYALDNNTTGSGNTAVGDNALTGVTSGGANIAVGNAAGLLITGSNSNNIDIGSPGADTDNGVIRIGFPGTHTVFVAAGIWNTRTNPGPVPVMIDQYGVMGTFSSSRRYKEGIEDMSDASSGLLRLRPVKFRYRKPYADGSKPIDYGLIAEEVAEIYPDLVVKNAEGEVETVQYQKLTPMLLNELQKERRERSEEQRNQKETIQSLQAQVSALQKALETLIVSKVQPAGDVSR